jgi:DNA polymerase epsilon subunit 3
MTSIDDFELPKACIMRVIKAALPDNALVNKEAKIVMTKSATVFINYLTATANEFTRSTNKKILSASDIFSALETLEFDEFSDRLRDSLEEYRKIQKQKSKRNQQNKKDLEDENKNSSSKGKDEDNEDDIDENNDEEDDLAIDSDNDNDTSIEDDDVDEEDNKNESTEENEDKENENDTTKEISMNENAKDKKSKILNKNSKSISESDGEPLSDADSNSNLASGYESNINSDNSSVLKSNKKRKAGDMSFDGSSKRRNIEH